MARIILLEIKACLNPTYYFNALKFYHIVKADKFVYFWPQAPKLYPINTASKDNYSLRGSQLSEDYANTIHKHHNLILMSPPSRNSSPTSISVWCHMVPQIKMGKKVNKYLKAKIILNDRNLVVVVQWNTDPLLRSAATPNYVTKIHFLEGGDEFNLGANICTVAWIAMIL